MNKCVSKYSFRIFFFLFAIILLFKNRKNRKHDFDQRINTNDYKSSIKHNRIEDYEPINEEDIVKNSIANKPQPPKDNSFYDHDLAVMILSRRESFKSRKIIRETWAKNQKNVFFIVGEKSCPIPDNFRKNYYDCQAAVNISTMRNDELISYQRQQYEIELKLKNEPNVVMIPVIDTYANLTRKVKEGIHWMMGNGNPRWLLKIDDDSVARLQTLENYLKENYSDSEYLYMGTMNYKSEVHRQHEKWPELHYKKGQSNVRYPTYANGCCGYVLSNRIVRYISDHSDKLFNYHNEDTAIGIWIEESGFMHKVDYVDEKDRKWFVSEAHSGFFCSDREKFSQYIILGHHLRPSRIRQCYNVLFNKRH